MKNTLVTLLAVAALTLSANAQEKNGMKGRHHQHHALMAKQLNFSAEQQKQARANHEEFRKKMQELNKNESITVKEFRDRKAALRKEQKTKMEGLLTPEQKNKMALLKAQHKVRADERFSNHLNKMKADLALTDAQLARLKTQREANHLKMKSIKSNESLSREQRKEQMMALRTEAKEQRKKIFTAEQMKKMEEMKKKHMDKQPVK